MPPHLDIIAIIDRLRPGDLAPIRMKRLVPRRRDPECTHPDRVVQALNRLLLDRLAVLALVPAMRHDHIAVVSIRPARAFPAVRLDNIQLVARHIALPAGISHVVGHQPERRPRPRRIRPDKPAFKIARRRGGDTPAVIVHR